MYFFWPVCLSSQERVCKRPSTYTFPPFLRYSPAISASRCQSTTLCHSVRSCHSPPLSLKRSLVASVILATAVPLGVYLISGSFPRLPIRITLLTLFMISLLLPRKTWPPWELGTSRENCCWLGLGVQYNRTRQGQWAQTPALSQQPCRKGEPCHKHL